MANPEIQPMMDSIGFVYSPNSIGKIPEENGLPGNKGLSVFPNPSAHGCKISFTLAGSAEVQLEIHNMKGRKVLTLIDGESLTPGKHEVEMGDDGLAPGSYILRLALDGTVSGSTILIIR